MTTSQTTSLYCVSGDTREMFATEQEAVNAYDARDGFRTISKVKVLISADPNATKPSKGICSTSDIYLVGSTPENAVRNMPPHSEEQVAHQIAEASGESVYPGKMFLYLLSVAPIDVTVS